MVKRIAQALAQSITEKYNPRTQQKQMDKISTYERTGLKEIGCASGLSGCKPVCQVKRIMNGKCTFISPQKFFRK